MMVAAPKIPFTFAVVFLILSSAFCSVDNGWAVAVIPGCWLQDEIQDPDEALLLAQTAVAAQNDGDYKLAAQEWERLLKEFPQASLVGKAHYNAGVCYVQTLNFEKAAGHLSTAINKLDADDTVQLPQAHLYLGFSQLRTGQSLGRQSDQASQDEAKSLLTTSTRTFTKLLEKFPKFVDADQACFFQGNAFEDLRRLEEAEAAYEKMFSYPKQAFKFDGLFAIGNVNEQLGNFTRALEYYDKFRDEAKAAGGSPLLEEVNFRTAKTMMRLAAADIGRGDSETAQKNFSAAAGYLKSIAEQDRDSASAAKRGLIDESQFQWAYCLTQLDDFETAASIYQAITQQEDSPFREQARVYAGNCLSRTGDLDSAETILKAAVEADSDFSVEAVAALTALYIKKEDPGSAFELADQWIKRTDDHRLLPSLMMDRADAIYQIPERRKESPAYFMKLVDRYPDHELAPAAMYNAAYALLETGNLQQAIATADKFADQFPNDSYLADTLEIKADALLLDNESGQSFSVFSQLVESFPENEKKARWTLRAGLAAYLHKDYQGAIDWLLPRLEELTQPEQAAEAHHWIGSSQFNLDQFQAAAQSLQKSVDVSSDWRRADETQLTLARSLYKTDADEKANQVAEQLMEDFPESPLLGEAHYYVGENQYEAGDFENAYKHFAAVMEQFPESRLVPFSIYNAAWCKLEQKQFEDSEKLFSKLIDVFPDHELAQKARVGRGAARRKTGKTAESIADLKASLEASQGGAAKNNALYELGLAQVEQQAWQDAIKTFDQLLVDEEESPRADRYHYELAWAHNALQQSKEAVKHFQAIVDQYPNSDLAPEANFHVGSANYESGNYAAAITAYQSCVNSTAEESIREKAAYKLGWTYYKQKIYDEAGKQFDLQTRKFPEGVLYADGVFMLAECQFRLKKHDEALQTYLVAKPAIEKAQNVDPKIELLTRLHGAQSANKVGKYSEAIQLARPVTESDVDDAYQQDAWLQIGIAQEGLKNDEAALQAWRIAEKNFGKTGARATCMIGDLFFRQKKFDDAIREFKLIYYRFGKDAPDDIRAWQAYALYEAARCNYVQVANADEPSKSEFIREAIKHFENLVEDFESDRLAPEAKKQLENLKKLQSAASGI
jgi:TolA-binding protein